jgi:drug/metabolite transporter (DMT)-like permease
VSRRAAWTFAALGIAWGIPYLLIKVAVGELSPSQLVLARTGLAAVLLLPVALARGQVPGVLRRWPAVLAYTIVEIAVPWVFLSRAEQQLPSSTTGLLIAAVPLAGLAVAALTGRPERLGASGRAGLLLGVLGVAALVGLDIGGSELGPVLEVGVVVLGYAVGPAILSRWLGDLPGLGVVAVSLTLCALLYLPVVLLDGLPPALPSTPVVLSVVALAVVCTAAAFLMLFFLIAEIGPVRATTITYVNPAVAVVAGVLVLHEPVTGWTVLGFVLVVLGSVLVTRRPGTSATAGGSAGRVVTAPADGPCVGSPGEPGTAS